jgi:hypothetical protein
VSSANLSKLMNRTAHSFLTHGWCRGASEAACPRNCFHGCPPYDTVVHTGADLKCSGGRGGSKYICQGLDDESAKHVGLPHGREFKDSDPVFRRERCRFRVEVPVENFSDEIRGLLNARIGEGPHRHSATRAKSSRSLDLTPPRDRGCSAVSPSGRPAEP